MAQTQGPIQPGAKPPSNDGWVDIPQKGLPPAPKNSPDPKPEAAPPKSGATAPTRDTPPEKVENERPPALRRNPNSRGPRRGDNLPPPMAVPPSAAEMIDRAQRATVGFAQSIPNFVCDQTTLRYAGEGRRARLEDRIEAEILWVEGQESYRNMRRNGKPIPGDTVADNGAWATGDYYTTALNLFAPSTKAVFEESGDATMAGRRARLFDYKVAQANSRWNVDLDGCEFKPAYRGKVWIDIETSRVLRLEMAAVDSPNKCALGAIETFVEYGEVRIGERTHLLPAKAGSLVCNRGAASCHRNETEFRNYRQFTVETTIRPADPGN